MLPLTLPATDSGLGSAAAGGPKDWRQKLPFFYGWVVVGAAFMCLALTYAVWYSFSVFYVALLEEFGWSRALAAGVFSLFVVTAGLCGVLAGVLADRFGPGRVASAGAAIMAAGLLACSRIGELWQFYLFYGVVAGVGVAIAGWVPSVTMISRWFNNRLGVAVGIASSGIGAGILVMVPFSQWLINQVGWRSAYQVLAVMVLVGVVPLALLVMRDRPEALGLAKDGRSPGSVAGPSAGKRRLQVVDQRWASREWTLGAAAGTHRFWWLMLMMGINAISTQAVFVHQVAFLTDGGYDKMLAASIVGLIGLASVGAKAGWGWVSDRLGREVTWTLGLSFLALSIPILISTRLVALPPLVYLFAVIFALGYGASTSLAPLLAADIFVGRHFGAIYGTLGAANGLGAALGAWMAGFSFDVTGSYFAAFGGALISTLLSIGAAWLAGPRQVRRVRAG